MRVGGGLGKEPGQGQQEGAGSESDGGWRLSAAARSNLRQASTSGSRTTTPASALPRDTVACTGWRPVVCLLLPAPAQQPPGLDQPGERAGLPGDRYSSLCAFSRCSCARCAHSSVTISYGQEVIGAMPTPLPTSTAESDGCKRASRGRTLSAERWSGRKRQPARRRSGQELDVGARRCGSRPARALARANCLSAAPRRTLGLVDRTSCAWSALLPPRTRARWRRQGASGPRVVVAGRAPAWDQPTRVRPRPGFCPRPASRARVDRLRLDQLSSTATLPRPSNPSPCLASQDTPSSTPTKRSVSPFSFLSALAAPPELTIALRSPSAPPGRRDGRRRPLPRCPARPRVQDVRQRLGRARLGRAPAERAVCARVRLGPDRCVSGRSARLPPSRA